jgi:uncharacterized protein YbjT (DUF2867 family)
MKIKAIIFGASGMVGEGVLLLALIHPDVESVLVIGRRTCGVNHPKLTEIIHKDFYNYSSIADNIKGYNACFFCLGVSSVGMNEYAYHRVTYDLTMAAAAILSRLNPDMTFCYVSGSGTDSTEKGRLMWARVKGKTENHLMALPFKAAYMFRPGFMHTVNGQKNIKSIFKVVDLLYPLVKFLLPNAGCKLEDVAVSMIICSKSGYSKKILDNKDIDYLAGINNTK